jgi:hypothetical protein
MENMYPVKQYPVRLFCPISNTEEFVFFQEVKTETGYGAKFNGCDHQYSNCPECAACKKAAYEKLISGSD